MPVRTEGSPCLKHCWVLRDHLAFRPADGEEHRQGAQEGGGLETRDRRLTRSGPSRSPVHPETAGLIWPCKRTLTGRDTAQQLPGLVALVPSVPSASRWAPSQPCLEHAHCLSTVFEEEEAATAGGIGGGAECVNLPDFSESSERTLLRVGSVPFLDTGGRLCTQVGWPQPEGWNLNLIHSFNKLI